MHLFGKIIFVATGLICILGTKLSLGQSLSAGVALLDSKWTLNSSIRTTLDTAKRISVSGIYQYDKYYHQGESKNMAIGSIGYAITSSFHTLVGIFYSTALNWSPSVSVQYLWSKRNFKGVLYPIFILHDPMINLTFLRVEYSNSINSKLNYFLRFQPYIVSGFWKHYYTRAGTRAGIKIKSWEIGFALDNDFVGNELQCDSRVGIFVQKKFNLK